MNHVVALQQHFLYEMNNSRLTECLEPGDFLIVKGLLMAFLGVSSRFYKVFSKIFFHSSGYIENLHLIFERRKQEKTR